MTRARAIAFLAFAAWLLGTLRCSAAPADSGGTRYTLITPPSSLQIGCQGPCACPIVELPTYGSFVLVKTGVDPLYTYYAVEDYIASFNDGPGAVAITGSGQYKVGGEVAYVQELTLDLQVLGRPSQHFDSGLKPVTTAFPLIDVSCAVHGFYCYDSVLVVDAKPVYPTGVAALPLLPAGLRTVRPNPFRTRTEISFNLDRAGPVDLTIIDVEGRRVRALVAGENLGSGLQTVIWEGRRDDGRVAPAGVYWVLLRWAGGIDRRRFTKLN